MYIHKGQEIADSPDPSSGLFVQPRNSSSSSSSNNNGGGGPVKASIPHDCCAFQIGESSQILSGGLLRATPHAVRAGSTALLLPYVTRESFALFLQPNDDYVLHLPTGISVQDLGTPVRSDIEPLQSRWTPGQTFGEFHWATIRKFVVKD
jgi:isopenicillin N synthase-like dioxygenase